MFKRTGNSQLDLFHSFDQELSSRSLTKLKDETTWFNIFNKQFVSRIDEQPYAVLFHDRMGRPNASIKALIGMTVLKEGFGWSDAQLFDQCSLNVGVMRALGLNSITEDTPGSTAYYDLRCRMKDHLETTGEDLLQDSFAQVTSEQVIEFGVEGSMIRMDSKLIQSNITKSNRVHMIMEAVYVTIRKMLIQSLSTVLTDAQYATVCTLQEHGSSHICYTLTQSGRASMLEDLGYIIKGLIDLKMIDEDSILYRIFKEQYQIEQTSMDDQDKDDEQIDLKAPEEVTSGSVQSIHDPEAAYRKKGKGQHTQKVQGYHSNLTETCAQDDKPNLITDVDTTPANVCEDEMLLRSTQRSQEVLGQDNQIEEVITDGGYYSPDNVLAFATQDAPDLRMPKTKGNERVYRVEKDASGGYVVKDINTGEICEITFSDRAKKYRVRRKKDKTSRYFTQEQLMAYIATQEIQQGTTDEHYNIRANVESTVHQTFHRLHNRQKIVYRGIIKCHWYVLSRSLWVNIVRITKYSNSIMTNIQIFFFLCSRIHHGLRDSHARIFAPQVIHLKMTF